MPQTNLEKVKQLHFKRSALRKMINAKIDEVNVLDNAIKEITKEIFLRRNPIPFPLGSKVMYPIPPENWIGGEQDVYTECVLDYNPLMGNDGGYQVVHTLSGTGKAHRTFCVLDTSLLRPVEEIDDWRK